MGQPGRQLAQGQQPLALPDQGVGAGNADEHALQQVDRHRVPPVEHLTELAAGQRENPAIAQRPHRRRVGLVDLITEVELGGTEVDPTLVGARYLDLLPGDQPGHSYRPRQQHVEAAGRLALGDNDRAVTDFSRLAMVADPVKLGVG